ncbi:MAG TPA: hypothetical protein VD766_07165, partial [Solirubrobacterales bacterium]|nr:hypothetical protein [Solirubrobacterales bacterium]
HDHRRRDGRVPEPQPEDAVGNLRIAYQVNLRTNHDKFRTVTSIVPERVVLRGLRAFPIDDGYEPAEELGVTRSVASWLEGSNFSDKDLLKRRI